MKCLIQIGSNAGDVNVFNIIYKNNINKCIFVDGNDSILKSCRDNFEKFLSEKNVKFDIEAHFVNCIISNSSEQFIDFNIPNDTNLSGHSSIYSHQLSELSYITKKVENTTLENLLNFFKLKTIDYLLVDAEGCDKEILSTLNWNIFDIKNIKFEFTHWDGYKQYTSNNLNQFIFFLLMRGYTIKKSTPTDITACL